MSEAIPAEQLMRYVNASAEQRDVIDRYLLGTLAECELAALGSAAEPPRYALRHQMDIWQVVFDGRKALVKDGRAMRIVAYLLLNPPSEPIHAVPLEAQVWGRELEAGEPERDEESSSADETDPSPAHMPEEMNCQASGARLDQVENILLKRKFRELLEIIEDGTLPQAERDAAQEELDQLHAALDGAAGRVVDGAAKAAFRVRKAIKRLHNKLATAVDGNHQPDTVLRDFAAHLLTHLIIPSSRFNRGKGSRNRAGVAGTFTYEPPAGMVWKD